MRDDWLFDRGGCSARTLAASLGAGQNLYTLAHTQKATTAAAANAGIHFHHIKFNFTLFIRRRPCLLFLFLLYAHSHIDLRACIFFPSSIQFKQRDSQAQVVCFCVCRAAQPMLSLFALANICGAPQQSSPGGEPRHFGFPESE